MFNVNGPELIALAVLFLLLFGPERLPEVVMQLARWIGRFRALTDQATAEIRREFELAAHEAEAAKREFEQLTLEAKQAVASVEKETQRAITAAESGASGEEPPALAPPQVDERQAAPRPESSVDAIDAVDEPAPSIGGDRAVAAERDAAATGGST
jgi:Sec-independent protein translocase protein TatA